jgi:hypothetical protein
MGVFWGGASSVEEVIQKEGLEGKEIFDFAKLIKIVKIGLARKPNHL